MARKHLMVDLETFGTGVDSVVVSVGAAVFDPTEGATLNEPGRQMWRLNIQDQLDRGRTITGATIKWWFNQSDEAIRDWNHAESTCKGMTEFEGEFKELWKSWNCQYIWSHGSTFDVMILDSMFNGKCPWKFWDVRDTRTLLHVTNMNIDRAQGTHHSAIDDAVAQAQTICKSWKVASGTS
tara:strand:- start:5626 stop:6168 length:543 start_codon:yes stop_codon:yes gene_type:complete